MIIIAIIVIVVVISVVVTRLLIRACAQTGSGLTERLLTQNMAATAEVTCFEKSLQKDIELGRCCSCVLFCGIHAGRSKPKLKTEPKHPNPNDRTQTTLLTLQSTLSLSSKSPKPKPEPSICACALNGEENVSSFHVVIRSG